MRKVILGIALAGYAVSAAAAGIDELDARDTDTSAYSARVYYRLDFGGPAAQGQSVGLRFDNAMTEHASAAALLQASLDSSGVTTIRLRGVQLRGPAIAAGEDQDDNTKKGFWASLSTGEWLAIGLTAAVLAGTLAQTAGGGGGVSGTGGS